MMSIVDIDCENLDANPHCIHGPTLKFLRLMKGKKEAFFACSACRDRKLCPFFLKEGEKLSQTKATEILNEKNSLLAKFNHKKLYKRLKRVYMLNENKRQYCFNCDSFIFTEDLAKHSSHNKMIGITNNLLNRPSKILKSLHLDKKEAQYIFAPKTIDIIMAGIKACKVDGILCVGTPSLHEAAKHEGIHSILLDIDSRFFNFYSPQEFCWYNMFNNYFLSESKLSEEVVSKIMKCSHLTLIVDPPFGARLEPLTKTIHSLNIWYKSVNKKAKDNIQVFLFLPYFMHGYIEKNLPDLQILDYVVEYTDHKKFKTRDSKTPSSPVRIFTNSDRSLFTLPESEGYSFCTKCQRWVGSYNSHCDQCNSCTSMGISSFVHCFECNKCVKKSWLHCSQCNNCFPEYHKCNYLKTTVAKFHDNNVRKHSKRRKKVSNK